MNYVSGIGLSLWALVAWIALRERNLGLRLTVSALFVAALFFCHLFVLGTYGLGLLAFELHRLWISPSLPSDRRRPARIFSKEEGGAGGTPAVRALPPPLFDFVAPGLPSLPGLPPRMVSPNWGLPTQLALDP